MGFRAALIKPFAKSIARSIDRWSAEAVERQQKTMELLVSNGRKTAFGKDHHLHDVGSYEEFKEAVPIRDYEDLRPYVNRIKDGESDVLWPGLPRYFAKTSGTTSGVKYIPMSRESTPHHFSTARDALFNYYARTGNGKWLDGKLIFLSGSPTLDDVGGIPTGRLSGISNHLVPAWLRTNQMPSLKTNLIEDWEEKVERIVDETLNADMRLISGIPPWVQMYYERLLERSGKQTVRELFPNFSVFVYGGVNFEPYRAKLEELVGGPMDSVETYPASEGFIAFQDTFPGQGLLLNADAGMFFEFIPLEDFHSENPKRLWLDEVELGVDYVLILHTNAGLWGYNIGDTVRFVSKDPFRLIVSGRVKHFISAFGEHVIGKEVEEAILPAAREKGIRIVEFSVAPQVNPPEGGLPYHEWFVEFDNLPDNMNDFSLAVDKRLREQNIYYDDLIVGNILKPLVLRPLKRDAFRNYMKSQGKLGGQNKVPRLANDRKIADFLQNWLAVGLLMLMSVLGFSQERLLVSDQTFKLTGTDEHFFALAEGDRIDLRIDMLIGKDIREVEFYQYPDYTIIQDYKVEQSREHSFVAPKTDLYVLRFKENGMGKKVCRFTLHRTPAGPETEKMDTRVTWDLSEYPDYTIGKRRVQKGVTTELVSLGGRVTISGSRMGLQNAVNAWQFSLPPHTVRWAYRMSVGQAVKEARKKDASALAELLKRTAVKAAAVQPETALAAFALGMSIDLTTSTSGEDVQYALVDAGDVPNFFDNGSYDAVIEQKGISVDVQRMYSPLEGTWFFVFRSDNWVNAIDVYVDIEAVTEMPVYVEEMFLEPVR